MIPLPPQQWELDLAYQRGYERGLRVRTMNSGRRIRVNLSSFSVSTASLGLPSYLTFDVLPDTSVSEVLDEVLGRLPDIPYPFTITTSGSNPRILGEGQTMHVASILPQYDSTVLTLRLNIELPEHLKERKKGMGAKLRTALGRSSSGDNDDGISIDGRQLEPSEPRRETQRLQPPTYEEATRSNS